MVNDTCHTKRSNTQVLRATLSCPPPPATGAVTSSSQAPRTTHETPGPETRSSPRGLPPSQTHSHRRPLVTTRAASVTDTQPPTPPRHQERCLCHRHTATDAPSSPSTPNVITRFEYPVPVLHLPLGPPHNQTRTAHAAAGAEPLRILGNSPTGGHRPQPRVVSPRYAVSGPRPHKLSHAGKPTQPRAQTHSHRHTPTPTLTSLLPGSVPAATTRTSAQAPLPASAPRACALPSGTPEHRWPRPLTRATRRRDAAPPPGLPPERKAPPLNKATRRPRTHALPSGNRSTRRGLRPRPSHATAPAGTLTQSEPQGGGVARAPARGPAPAQHT